MCGMAEVGEAKKFCIVDGCYNFTGTCSKISFHPIRAVSAELMVKWKEVVSISRERGYICSEHFNVDSFYFSAKTQGYHLIQGILPVKAIPDRWIHLARPKETTVESSSLPQRRKNENMLYWQAIAQCRKAIDERLQKRDDEKIKEEQQTTDDDSDEEEETRPWWFTRDVSKEENTPFWDESNPEAWTRLWPDELIEYHDKKKKRRSALRVMKTLMSQSDSESSDGHEPNDGDSLELQPLYPKVMQAHPGATDECIDDGIISMDGQLKQEEMTTNRPPGESSIRIRSLEINSPYFQDMPFVIQPVLHFRGKKEIWDMRAHHAFSHLQCTSLRKARVLEVAQQIAESYVEGCFKSGLLPEARKSQSSTPFEKELRKQRKTFSVKHTNSSIEIKVHKTSLHHRHRGSPSRRLISAELLKFRRAERALKMAISKERMNLRRVLESNQDH